MLQQLSLAEPFVEVHGDENEQSLCGDVRTEPRARESQCPVECGQRLRLPAGRRPRNHVFDKWRCGDKKRAIRNGWPSGVLRVLHEHRVESRMDRYAQAASALLAPSRFEAAKSQLIRLFRNVST